MYLSMLYKLPNSFTILLFLYYSSCCVIGCWNGMFAVVLALSCLTLEIKIC